MILSPTGKDAHYLIFPCKSPILQYVVVMSLGLTQESPTFGDTSGIRARLLRGCSETVRRFGKSIAEIEEMFRVYYLLKYPLKCAPAGTTGAQLSG